MTPSEVFLSHASEDAPMPQNLATALVRHGIPVFFAPLNVTGAQQWQNEILAAIQRCDWFVVIISPNAIESMWVKREVAYALQDRRYENRIIPIRLSTVRFNPYSGCPFFR